MDEQGDLIQIRHFFPIIFPTESNPWYIFCLREPDLEWLQALNMDRKRLGQEPVTCELFEIVMDRLEKEWFQLVRVAAYFHYILQLVLFINESGALVTESADSKARCQYNFYRG